MEETAAVAKTDENIDKSFEKKVERIESAKLKSNLQKLDNKETKVRDSLDLNDNRRDAVSLRTSMSKDRLQVVD